MSPEVIELPPADGCSSDAKLIAKSLVLVARELRRLHTAVRHVELAINESREAIERSVDHLSDVTEGP